MSPVAILARLNMYHQFRALARLGLVSYWLLVFQCLSPLIVFARLAGVGYCYSCRLVDSMVVIGKLLYLNGAHLKLLCGQKKARREKLVSGVAEAYIT